MIDDEPQDRPVTRGDCVGGPRPCPWVSCKHHLLVEIRPRDGLVVLRHGHDDVELLKETCALDVADWGGAQLYEVDALMSIEVKHIERDALAKLKKRVHRDGRRRR